MKNQRAYVFISCLMLITLILALSFFVIEQVNLEKRSLSIQLNADQKELKMMSAIQELIQQASSDTCQVSWQEADNFDRACFVRQNDVELRYVLVMSPQKQLQLLSGLARVSDKGPWVRFQAEMGGSLSVH